MNKKSFLVAAGVVALVGAGTPAVAATLSNGNGQSCEGVGVYHFVNNQTGGASAGTLNATFSDGTVWNVAPSKVLRSVQHFYVQSSGTLVTAQTNLPGRLVLSDYTCEDDGEKK